MVSHVALRVAGCYVESTGSVPVSACEGVEILSNVCFKQKPIYSKAVETTTNKRGEATHDRYRSIFALVRLRSCMNWGGRQATTHLAQVVDGPFSIHAHPRPR
jgi:hypothetical protein